MLVLDWECTHALNMFLLIFFSSGERETFVRKCEKKVLVASHIFLTGDWTWNPGRYVPSALSWNWTGHLLVHRTTHNQLSHTGQGPRSVMITFYVRVGLVLYVATKWLSFCIPTSNGWEFLLLHILTSIWWLSIYRIMATLLSV